MSKFQIIVLSIFVICIIAGVIAFATFKGGGTTTSLPAVSIWGTFPSTVVDKYVSDINQTSTVTITVNYKQIKPDQFSAQFISALAKGTGPDAVLIPADMILPHLDKFSLIPYSSIPQRTYMDTYIQEANIYLNQNGIIGFPFTVDPLVLYWNRDMFNAAGIATYPRYWDEFNNIIPKLTVKDSAGTIKKSALAMGDFSNMTNARELLGTLFMQLGNPITAYVDSGLETTVSSTGGTAPRSVLQFFTQFVDPASPNYSWNRGMPNDKTAFLSGITATYFGFASELKDIRAKNPNLNFDVAPLPQVRSGGVKDTYGRMYGFSLVKSSPNISAAYQVIMTMESSIYLSTLVDTLYLPSVRRATIAGGTTDPYIDIFNQSALVASTWLDADPTLSRQLFANMVQNVTSGRNTVIETIQDTGDQYNVILRNATQ